jgi:hypothetical protein
MSQKKERGGEKNAIYLLMPAAKGSARTLLGPIYRTKIRQSELINKKCNE